MRKRGLENGGKSQPKSRMELFLKHQKYGMIQETHGGNAVEKLGGFFFASLHSFRNILDGDFSAEKHLFSLEYDV